MICCLIYRSLQMLHVIPRHHYAIKALLSEQSCLCLCMVYELSIAWHSRTRICKQTTQKLVFACRRHWFIYLTVLGKAGWFFYVECLAVGRLEISRRAGSEQHATLSHWSLAVEAANEKIHELPPDLLRSHLKPKSDLETLHSFSSLCCN